MDAWNTVRRIAIGALLVSGCSGSATPAAPTLIAASSPTPPGAQASSQAPTREPSTAPSAPATASPMELFGALPAVVVQPDRAAALQQALDEVVAAGAPDAIAAVITPNGTWSGAAGIGGPDGRKATPADEFAIASVTKMFTAALVMRLAAAHKLDLDQPLSAYLGGIDVDTNGATVRQVLGMRSGFADYVNPADAIAADPAHHWTTAELLTRIPAPSAPAGTSYLEAGPNYFLLSLAIEHVTGKPFAMAIREVLDPVGARRILQQGGGTPTPKPWALPTEPFLGQFHVSDLGAGGAISCISSASFGPGSGSMASDAPSVAVWMWHLLAGDIVDRDSLSAMLPTSQESHGLGLEALGGLGTFSFGQTGGKTGYGTIVAVFPDRQGVVVLLVNDPDFVVEGSVLDLLHAATGR